MCRSTIFFVLTAFSLVSVFFWNCSFFVQFINNEQNKTDFANKIFIWALEIVKNYHIKTEEKLASPNSTFNSIKNTIYVLSVTLLLKTFKPVSIPQNQLGKIHFSICSDCINFSHPLKYPHCHVIASCNMV